MSMQFLKFFKKINGALLFILIFSLAGQSAYSQQVEERQEVEISRPRRQITTIVFAGLAGAVLGLSTLSFYGRPQDKLSNIAIGFALGVISGAVYTTFKAATNPYDEVYVRNMDFFEGTEKSMISSSQRHYELDSKERFTPQLAWRWSF